MTGLTAAASAREFISDKTIRAPGSYPRKPDPATAPVIARAETSAALFIDRFGPSRSVETFTSFNDFSARFSRSAHPEAHENVRLFFLNGGRRALTLSIDDASAAGVIGARPARGLRRLEDRAELGVGFICVPVAARLDAASASTVYDQALAAATKQKALVLIDTPFFESNDFDVKNLQKAWLTPLGIDHPNAAIFVPRLQTPSLKQTISASGVVAGVAARIDQTRGVWNAPAGLDATIRGAKPAQSIDNAALERLTQHNVNAIRTFPSVGTVVWGARVATSDPEWKYVSVRRTALFLEKSLGDGLEWSVFESNDESLWRKVSASIEDFMTELWRDGAFQGALAKEAFFVRCDRTTTTQAEINEGFFNVVIGFAPLKPAEFIVLRLTRKTVRP